jgi:hypothetical protein
VSENHEVQVGRRRSPEEINRLVDEFEASGARVSDFCRNHDLAKSIITRDRSNVGITDLSLRSWLGILRNRGQVGTRPGGTDDSSPARRFIAGFRDPMGPASRRNA